MKSLMKATETVNESGYGFELSPETINTFNEMVSNVLSHPISHFFKDELSLFNGSILSSVLGFGGQKLLNLNITEEFAKNSCSVNHLKGLIVTYSDVDLSLVEKLNDQINSLPEDINCIVYGGVRLTSEENQVEIFVFL